MNVSLEGIDAFDNVIERLLAAEREATRREIYNDTQKQELERKIKELEQLIIALRNKIAEHIK